MSCTSDLIGAASGIYGDILDTTRIIFNSWFPEFQARGICTNFETLVHPIAIAAVGIDDAIGRTRTAVETIISCIVSTIIVIVIAKGFNRKPHSIIIHIFPISFFAILQMVFVTIVIIVIMTITWHYGLTARYEMVRGILGTY
jgi:hypothetical protein